MENNKSDVIIIRGAPGSGKSQTAKMLSTFFPKGVKIEVDVLRQMVISVDWTNQEEHIKILELSTVVVYDFLKLGFRPVIIIDTFSGDKINKFLETLYSIDTKLKISLFGLFTSDSELKNRLDKRTNGEFKDFGICKKLNDDVQKIKHSNEIQINTTGLLPMETAKVILSQIEE